jgi:hypothetical protein
MPRLPTQRDDAERCEHYAHALMRVERQLREVLEDLNRYESAEWSNPIAQREAKRIRRLANLGTTVLQDLCLLSLAFRREAWDRRGVKGKES